MSKSPFDVFPHITTNEMTLRKIVSSDIESIFEIYSNDKLFVHSPTMPKKSMIAVANMIRHSELDFNEKKAISLGIALNDNPEFIVGVAEMYDYDSAVNMITIGYRLNDRFWGKGIATKTVKAITDYLFRDVGVNRLQAFVMPENTKSLNVLRRNNYVEEGLIRQGHVWKGRGVVDLALFSMLKSEYSVWTSWEATYLDLAESVSNPNLSSH